MEETVRALERRVRFLALAVGVLGALWVATLAVVWARPGGRVVARELVVTDAEGRVRGELAQQEDGAFGLVLSDAAGQRRALLGISPDGSPRTLPSASVTTSSRATTRPPGRT